MRGTVVVTRPTGQSGSLAQRLAEAGWESYLLPVFDIAPLADPAPVARAWRRIGEFDLIHFASANAIRLFFALRPDGAAFKPGALVAVMGPGSRAAIEPLLAHDQIEIVTPGQELPGEPVALDSETLMVTLESLRPQGLRGQRVLMVRGEGGRDWLSRTLADAGALVQGLPVYRRLCPQLSDEQVAALAALQARERPIAFVVTSSEGAQNLAAMVAPHEALAAFVRAAPLVVTHARVAQRAQSLGFTRVASTAPNDDAVVRKIESLCYPTSSGR